MSATGRIGLAVFLIVAVLDAAVGRGGQTLDPAPAESMVKKLQLIRERFEQDNSESADIEVSEEELNSYIVYRLSDRLPEGVVDPWVRLTDGPIQAGAMLDLAVLQSRMPQSSLNQLLSGRVPVELQARFHAEEGTGRIELESVVLGGIPLPKSFIQELVTSQTKSSERPEGIRLDQPFPLPYGLRSARTEAGRLILRQGGKDE